jgi:tetratricopeptide (TPR) repeat protein
MNRSKLKLEEVGPHQWRFIHPEVVSDLDEEFWEAVELMNEGKLKEAELEIRRIIKECSEFIDAYHHLALILDHTERSDEARILWQEAVNTGKKAFPAKFKSGTELLEWGWIENRPFLRAYEGLTMSYYQQNEVKEALNLFRDILSLNPRDNQGVRAVAIDAYFYLDQPEEVLKICEQYPDDILADTNYGKVLALLKLNKRQRAQTALKKAYKHLPMVAEELIKTRHRRPKSKMEGYVTIGGKDQAYEYWDTNKEYWNNTPGAIEFIRQYIKPDTG